MDLKLIDYLIKRSLTLIQRNFQLSVLGYQQLVIEGSLQLINHKVSYFLLDKLILTSLKLLKPFVGKLKN